LLRTTHNGKTADVKKHCKSGEVTVSKKEMKRKSIKLLYKLYILKYIIILTQVLPTSLKVGPHPCGGLL
jgi:hypothetical protein